MSSSKILHSRELAIALIISTLAISVVTPATISPGSGFNPPPSPPPTIDLHRNADGTYDVTANTNGPDGLCKLTITFQIVPLDANQNVLRVDSKTLPGKIDPGTLHCYLALVIQSQSPPAEWNPPPNGYTARIRVTLKIENGPTMYRMFAPDGTPQGQSVDSIFFVNSGPSTGAVLIHEFNDTREEANAFDAGTLDLMDWPPPRSFFPPWLDWCCGLVALNKASLSKFTDTGMAQMDLNSFNFPTNNKALRQAIGYLVDRQQIVNVFAGGEAVPICGGAAAVQPSAMSCLQLGYPTSFGEFSPSKAIQVLYEGGWRDSNNNGILEAPGGSSEPTLIFYVRQDDSIRRQAGDQLTQALLHLPKSFVSMAGPVQTVCASSPVCMVNVDERVLSRDQIAPIVFRGTGVSSWNIYTGEWSLGVDPDYLVSLYSTGYAWSTCGGGWVPNIGATNYPCNVDSTYDGLAQFMSTRPTNNDVYQAANPVQRYAWGYASGMITGTMPTVPMYTLQSSVAVYNSDVGANAIAGAHWKGYIGQEVGAGLGQLAANVEGVSLYNGQTGGAGYVSYRGQGVLDWGFKNHIQRLNIVTSESRWDGLALQQTYEPCLGRNPVKLAEIIPSICASFGQTTVFSAALGKQTTVAVYKFQDGVQWSDGDSATADDFKFSVEYVQKNMGVNFGLVQDAIRTDVIGADSASGKGGEAIVYFDDVGALFMQNAGFLPIVAKHVWCPDYDGTPAHDVGPLVAPRVGCPYPHPDLFPDFDFTQQVGTGPFVISSCTGVSCNATITLTPNLFYDRSVAYWNVAAGIQLQPDLNRDDRVNSEDLIVLDAASYDDITLDVDYRVQIVRTETLQVDPSVGSGVFTVYESGPQITSNDRYIINRLIFEGQLSGECDASCNTGGLVWPPAHVVLRHVWPDATRDNSVDLDDVMSVYVHQFQDPKVGVPPGANANAVNDVDYSGDMSLDDLVITFLRQFTKPVGMP